MKNILIFFSFFCLDALADLAVTPPLLQFKGDDKFNEVTIKNESNKDRLFNISIKKWSQENGEDTYTDTDDLFILPIMAQVKPNSEKVIRVILKKPASEAAQNSYRLFIREAPFGPKKETSGTSFQFLFSIIVPVFTHGKNFIPNQSLIYKAEHDTAKNKVFVTISNTGNTVQLLNKIDAKSVSNALYNQARYILPGAFYTYEFPLKVKKSMKEFTLNYFLNEKSASKIIDIIPFKESIDKKKN